MTKSLRPRVLIIGLSFTVVFVAVGVVFANLDLGVGDQVASIGSFIVGLASLVVSVVAAWRPLEQREAAAGLGTPKYQFKNISHVEDLTIGDHQNNTKVVFAEPKGSKQQRRR